jgi:hypothetical protein
VDLNRDRPPILTPRGFDRWLAAMVVLAFAVHLIILAITVLVGEFRLRPDAETRRTRSR